MRSAIEHQRAKLRVAVAVMGDHDQRRLQLSFLVFSAAEWSTWVAILVYGYRIGEATAVVSQHTPNPNPVNNQNVIIPMTIVNKIFFVRHAIRTATNPAKIFGFRDKTTTPSSNTIAGIANAVNAVTGT